MSERKNIIRKYQLVKFIGDEKNDASLLDIDRVPCCWVRYNIEKGETVTKFPPPPYSSKRQQALLEELIKTESRPLPNWLEYPVELVGHADTYEDSVKRLDTLVTQPFAYTTDSDTAPQVKALKTAEELKKQSLKEIMDVPRIGYEDSVESDYSISHEESGSSSDESQTRLSSKKIKTTRDKSRMSTHKNKVSKSKSTYTTSRSDKNKAFKSSKVPAAKKSCEPVIQRQKEERQKKKVYKPKDIDSDFSRSEKNIASKSSKPVASEESQEPVLQLLNTSKTAFDISDSVAQNTAANAEKPLEGAYIVQESGELELELESDERQSSTNNGSNYFDDMQKSYGHQNLEKEVCGLRKSSSFDRSLSKVFDIPRKTGKKYTEDTLLLLSALKGLSTDLQENTNAVNNLCAAIRNGKVSVDTSSKPKAFSGTDFQLPFKTLEDFKKFDSKLKDSKYQQQCAASLLFYIDRENHVTKSVTNILKKFVGRNVCMHFTAVKQMGTKEVFKDTKFSSIMFEVVTEHHRDNQGKPISEKYFFHCLGQAIANSKDWDGARLERAKLEKAKREKKASREMADE